MPYDPRQDPKYKDDKLFLSLLKRESRFNPNAVSPTGARGYAQVLKSTANDPGFGIAPNPAAVHDPEANVAFGKSYLDAMKKRYKGDDAAALVAYNGGPVAADRWVASGKNDKTISKESADYYKGVLKDAGSEYDFSKIKIAAPKGSTGVDDDEEETEKTTGFAKLKMPGSKIAKDKEERTSTEASNDEEDEDKEEKTTPKVKKTKASKKEEDDDDDDEDEEKGGKKGGAASFSFDTDAVVPKLKPFEAGTPFKPTPIVLGQTKLLINPLEVADNPRDR